MRGWEIVAYRAGDIRYVVSRHFTERSARKWRARLVRTGFTRARQWEDTKIPACRLEVRRRRKR